MSQPKNNSIGRLSSEAINDTLIDKTIEFIWNCLIPWHDDPERDFVESEEELNAQFHDFVQAKATKDFPMVLFQHEQRQEGRRRVDISVKPTKPTIIEGFRYSYYDPFIVIEGKRLPAPSKSRQREYISGEEKISGGIQRFKAGLHGKEHDVAIILGYLQEGEAVNWFLTINSWITDLSKSHSEEWNRSEVLGQFQSSSPKYRMTSTHPRPKECRSPTIQLLHFWIQCSRNGLWHDRLD